MSARALPETYRHARNLEEGYQIHAGCGQHEAGHWLTITHALHVLSPLKVSRFTLDVPECLPDLASFGDYSDVEYLSRRPEPVDEQAWRECAHRADYSSAAHHERECGYHRGEVDEWGQPAALGRDIAEGGSR